MIRLEHLNLVVQDIPKAVGFYKAAFPHWDVRTEGTGEWHGKPRNWMHFGDDYNYLTFNDNGEGNNRDLTGHQVGLSHLAFVVDNIEGIISRLAEAGFKPSNNGAAHPHRRNVYFIDMDGFEVEFVEYQSDIPEVRNSDAP